VIADIMNGLGLASVTLGFAALAGMILGRVRQRTVDGWFAIANALFAVTDSMSGNHAMTAYNSGICAWCAHRWWTGGGGDGTRRRLRSLRRRFSPVRRTAPAMTS